MTDLRQPDIIKPFHSINGIMPGLTKYSEAEAKLGTPDEIEVPKKLEVAGIEVGGNRIVHYRAKGISLLLTDNADAIVEGIYVEAPYRGRSENGLYLGMKKIDALAIVQRDYHITMDLGESILVAKDPDHTDSFQLWFTADVLSRVKLFSK
ncbi:MAG: hypothetical protein HYU79_05040 [Nitrosomonadales bacterium]|nr:hypothetical protein [Nitrosomonadales bacterium]